ncbi:hypothetical protein [Frankia sp. Cj3]|uniref:hypothetical protein n=1 Tax=Frankia sp. Cj3 TaxID=2880976 RepID=UPI001EF4FBEB|nr:hypothetical protein [Frankia sp. Cj3]
MTAEPPPTCCWHDSPTSPPGNLVTAEHDYRVLQPHTVVDANGNATHLRHDELGMLVATAIAGKPGDATGDSLDADGPDGVGTATSRLAYDLFAFRRTRDDPQPQPAAVHRYAREKHTARLAPGETVRVTHSIAYSDGFGREIQSKVPDEPAPDGSARWVGTGWTVYDEKSRPIRKYEPFFSPTPGFEYAAATGVSSILRYDPIGRLVATVRPDHTYEKVVFSPWRRARWDGNDTVDRADPATDPDVGPLIATLDPDDYRPAWVTTMRQSADPVEQAAAEAAVAHAGTPSTVLFDVTGREFLAITHNRFLRDGVTVEERYRTRTVHDAEGNLRSVVDAHDRAVSECRYDMLGRLIREDSVDQGRRTVLPDARDAVVSRWDGFGRRHDTEYDPMGRPVALRVDGVLIEETTYGEGVPGAEDANLRGRVARLRDQSGELTTEAYDRRGSMIRGTRRLTARPTDRPDWSGPVALTGSYPHPAAEARVSSWSRNSERSVATTRTGPAEAAHQQPGEPGRDRRVAGGEQLFGLVDDQQAARAGSGGHQRTREGAGAGQPDGGSPHRLGAGAGPGAAHRRTGPSRLRRRRPSRRGVGNRRPRGATAVHVNGCHGARR